MWNKQIYHFKFRIENTTSLCKYKFRNKPEDEEGVKIRGNSLITDKEI